VRVIRLAVFWLLFSSFAFASDVTIKVVDPQAKVVPGARVVLVRSGESASFQVQSTTSEGEAVFSGVKPGGYQVRVLAPGSRHHDGAIENRST